MLQKKFISAAAAVLLAAAPGLTLNAAGKKADKADKTEAGSGGKRWSSYSSTTRRGQHFNKYAIFTALNSAEKKEIHDIDAAFNRYCTGKDSTPDPVQAATERYEKMLEVFNRALERREEAGLPTSALKKGIAAFEEGREVIISRAAKRVKVTKRGKKRAPASPAPKPKPAPAPDDSDSDEMEE